MPIQHWGKTQTVNTTISGNQQDASVAVLDGGGFVVVWTDTSTALTTIKGQMFDAGGTAVGSEFAIGSNQAAFNLREPDVTALSGGGFEVSFTKQISGTDYAIWGQQFTSGGTAVSPASALFDFVGIKDDFAHIARLGSGFAVAATADYPAQNHLWAATFNASGVQQSIDGVTSLGSPAVAGVQSYSNIAQLSNGNFVVTWMSNQFTISYRLYNSALTSLTGELSAGAFGTAEFPSVVAYGNGGFSICWDALPQFPDGGNRTSFIRTFNAAGTAVTNPLPLNAADSANNTFSRLTVLPDGKLFGVWQEFDGSTNFLGRVIDPMTGLGGSPIVITANVAPQNAAYSFNTPISIATLADGRIVSVWTDQTGADGASGNGIRMQILDPRDGLVTGTSGNDVQYGSQMIFNDMSGLAGNDVMYGGAVGDWMNGGAGNDVLYGLAGNDVLISGLGDDTSYAGVGDDSLYGEDGNDTLWGEAGNDFIAGQNGNDTMLGQDGNDFLFFEAGTDVGYGGSGSDQFYWNSYTQGADIVQDFNRAEGDQIWFDHTGFGMPAGWNLVNGFNFFYGAGVAPTQATATVYFTTENNILWFDIDGSGAGAATAITFLVGTPALQASDIKFV